jgi:hypothetical protein
MSEARLTSTGYRATATASLWRSRVGQCPTRSASGMQRAYRCAPEERLRGDSW